jgi:hypothetical protein
MLEIRDGTRKNDKHKLEFILPRFLGRRLASKLIISCQQTLINLFSTRILIFLSKYLGIHLGNTLLEDDTLYKNMFNELFIAIFVKSFDISKSR